MLYHVGFSFLSTKPRDWLGRTSPKSLILYRVGRKTLTQSVSQSTWLYRELGYSTTPNCRVQDLKLSRRQQKNCPTEQSSLNEQVCNHREQLRPGAATWRTVRNIRVVFDSCLLATLRENPTSSTKPEVHNTLHCRLRRTEPRSPVRTYLSSLQDNKQRTTLRPTSTSGSKNSFSFRGYRSLTP